MTNKIFCVVGMAGSGKSLVADELVKRGLAFLRFGQITLDKVKEQNLEVNEKNERKISVLHEPLDIHLFKREVENLS